MSVVDYSVLMVDFFLVSLCVYSLINLSKVPVVVYLVGFFAMLVSLSIVFSGINTTNVVYGWVNLLAAVFGGVSMLLTGLGVRVRR